jgi:hypothetical protein
MIPSKLVAEEEQRLVAAWAPYASARGLTLLPSASPWNGVLKLHGFFSGVEVAVELRFVGEASVLQRLTVRARAFSPMPIKSQVKREDGLSGLTELLGTEDLQVGNPTFDAMFVVKADSRALVPTLYGPEVQQTLFALPQGCAADYEQGAITVHSDRQPEPALVDVMAAVAAAFARAGSAAHGAVATGATAAYRGALPVAAAAQPMPAPGLGEHGLWGLLILFFGVGYAGLAGEASRTSTLYQKAKPLSANDASVPVLVTGPIEAEELSSKAVKPGRYIAIHQAAEVLAWDESSITSKNSTQYTCTLTWTSNPRPPSSFQAEDCRSKPAFKKPPELEDQWPKKAVIRSGDRAIEVDLAEVEWKIDPVPPTPAQLVLGTNAITDTWEENLFVYTSAKCKAEEPEAGCERVRTSVRPMPDGDVTIIGKLEGDRLTKFETTLKGAAGDRAALMDAFSVDAAFEGFGIWLQRAASFVGIWVGLAFIHRPVRYLLRGIRWCRETTTQRLIFAVGTALGGVAVLTRSFALLLAFAAVAAIYFGSRAEAQVAHKP